MSQHTAAAIRRPRTDDRPLWDIVFGIEGYPAVLVAHELKLFALLADKPLSLDEICAAKHLAQRPAHALLAVATALGLLHLSDGRYALTPNSNLRFAATRSLARPNYYDAVPYRAQDDNASTVLLGNADLRPTMSWNVDVLAEHYFKSVGIVSAGVFYEFTIARFKHGHFTLAPSLEYDYVGARSIDRHTAGLGLRVAFYSGP